MGKYNVGDKVRIVSKRGFGWNSHGKMDKYLGAVMTIRSNAFGEGDLYRMEEDKHENNGGWCWGDWDIVGLVKDETPSEKIAEEKIVITHDGKVTTATLYGVFGNKETATARCAPEDKFDFNVGAALALERLTEKIEEAKNPLYNGKVVCIDAKINEFYTRGKIYQIKNGQITADDGRQFPKDNRDPIQNTARIHNFDEWKEWSTAKWIEVVE